MKQINCKVNQTYCEVWECKCVYIVCSDMEEDYYLLFDFHNVLILSRRSKQTEVLQEFPKLSTLTSGIMLSQLLINVKSASDIEMFNQLPCCCQ
jgi:hypothetical protein